MLVPFPEFTVFDLFFFKHERKGTFAIRLRTFFKIKKLNETNTFALTVWIDNMIRLLIILALIVYVLSKLSGLFFRVGASSQRNKNFQQRRPEGSIHVDSAPKKEKRGNIKGGDYVDYEEVK